MAENRNKTETVQRVAWGSRFLAATVVVPPSISELLNTDAMAVLAVIRNEAAATGRCTLPVARIAERANVGRAKVRAAIKLAERLEIIAIEIAPDRKRVIINRSVTCVVEVPTCRKKAGNSLPRSPDRVLRHVR